ncbi:DTW domain-containing protein 1 [Trichonephila inaurata madagascariensis]|uniref:tRNA-uridine aminocarboxypropyltransferase 1 n=1 Tax=Trichonephila inaurata madagascariensis TaxID=2747483 RepID=A0A8X6IV18_9ARAC|nr:DTW domain-containing protein 1 [Trichonephila inaurata madagascariensis]
MRIDDSSFLDCISARGTCPTCKRSRKYYCYTCYVPVKEVSERLPKVSLPIKIDIIKHPKEVDGKSTSAHAAVLAPDDVKIYNYPDFPSYENEKVLLIFPGKSAIPFQEWWDQQIHLHEYHCETDSNKNLRSSFELLNHKETNSNHQNTSVPCSDQNGSRDRLSFKDMEKSSCLPFSKVIFIDCTWRQSKAMYNDPRLKKGLKGLILMPYSEGPILIRPGSYPF